MKALPLILFALISLAQWAAPLSQIVRYEQTLAKGRLIRLKCSAPDPYDPLRGRYLAVRPEQNDITPAKGVKLHTGQYAYATLKTGDDGLTVLDELQAEPPASGDFVRVTVRWESGGKAHIEWPFDRFYLNEALAPEADKWYAESIRQSKGVMAEVRVHEGTAVLEDLTFDSKSFREILKQRVK
ncbi:MAG: GDYXXLXY domain-containing protein [Prosthecobacter sp.]